MHWASWVSKLLHDAVVKAIANEVTEIVEVLEDGEWVRVAEDEEAEEVEDAVVEVDAAQEVQQEDLKTYELWITFCYACL